LLQGPAQSIDGRVLAFDQGMTTRSILCRYRPLTGTTTLLVLRRGPDRCSAPRLILSEIANWNRPVPVPPPPDAHSLVLVRIHGVDLSTMERVRALLYKPAQRFVSLGGAPAARLVSATAADGLPLRVARGFDYPAPFALVPQAQTISVGKSGQFPLTGRPITYQFYIQSFAAP
jgi:hypothetical protein